MTAKLGASYHSAFSTDGGLLATSRGRAVCVWTYPQLRLLQTIKIANPSSVDFTPSGNALIIKDTSGTIFSVTKRGITRRLTDGCEGPAFQFIDDTTILDANWDGEVRMVNLLTGKASIIAQFAEEMITAIHSLPRSAWLLVHSPTWDETRGPCPPDYVSEWRTPRIGSKPRRTLRIRGADDLHETALDAKGKTLACVCDVPPTRLALVNAAEGSVLKKTKISYGGTGSDLSWSSDGKWLASVQDGRIVLYSDQLDECADWRSEYPCAPVFAPDGRLLLGSWEQASLAELPKDPAPRPRRKRN